MRNRTHQQGLVSGHWPYGYTPIRDTASGRVIGAELDPDKLPALELITRLFLEGTPYQHIADALQAARHPDPRSGKWHRTTVWNILHNPTYGGYVPWQLQPSPTKSDKFPALWDDTTYSAIQRELEHRDHAHGRRTTTLFIDVAFCGRCGGKMTRGHPGSGNKNPSWICANNKRHRIHCHNNNTLEPKLIAATTQYLQRLADPTILDQTLKERTTPEAGIRQQLADLQVRIDAINEKRQRLALALAAGDMQPAIYKQTDDLIAADLNTLNQKRAQLQDALQTIPDTDAQRQSIQNLLKHLPTLWALPSARVNALLRHAGIHIECENRQVTAIKLA